MLVDNKVVWITGASSGIGEHLSYALADKNAKLVLSSRNETALRKVKENCNTETLVLPLDITDFASFEAAEQKVIDEFGSVDILINNAGISQRSQVKDTDFSVVRRIMEVNFFGTVALTDAVLPGMLARKSGQIVIISSVVGKVGVKGRSSYSASKHALQGYFDSLRAEVHQDNITVTIICPGYVRTQMTINALKGDGSPNNKMAKTTAGGLAPDVFAAKAIRAIERDREEVYIGKKEVAAIYLKRFFPGIYSRVLNNIRIRE